MFITSEQLGMFMEQSGNKFLIMLFDFCLREAVYFAGIRAMYLL